MLAWLLRNNGYELLTKVIPGDPALAMAGAGLTVRGRGAAHQADVLGEFPFTPPFSLPIRMFVEAKSLRAKVDLPVVRNAWATIEDVNQFDVGLNPNRYRYVYALFSTSGFTREAVDFALTHQISLVDLTLPMYDALRAALDAAASAVVRDAVGPGSDMRLRQVARSVLGTAEVRLPNVPGLQRITTAIEQLRSALQASFGGEILLAFPPAPFFLALTGDVSRFLSFVAEHADHQVNIYRADEDATAPEWVIQADGGSYPGDKPGYQLRFSLPPHVEEWLLSDRRHARHLKKTSLATIMIYQERDGVPHAYQLRYLPRPRTTQERQA